MFIHQRNNKLVNFRIRWALKAFDGSGCNGDKYLPMRTVKCWTNSDQIIKDPPHPVLQLALLSVPGLLLCYKKADGNFNWARCWLVYIKGLFSFSDKEKGIPSYPQPRSGTGLLAKSWRCPASYFSLDVLLLNWNGATGLQQADTEVTLRL